MNQNIAFIGLGQMGYGMASSMRKKHSKESTFFINDVNRSQCDRFIKEFGQYGPIEMVASAKEAATKCDTIISMVPNPADARKTHLDRQSGTVAAPKNSDRLILDSSTIDPKTSREIGEILSTTDSGTYVDTPVAGGVLNSRRGMLTFMLGHAKPANGNDRVAGRIRDVVSFMADPEKIFWCGGQGNGVASKIADNYLAGAFCVAISEAMALGIRSGVDKHVLFELMRNGSGQCWIGDHHQPVPGLVESAPSSHDYEPFFKHPLMIKDLKFGVEAAKAGGIDPTIGETALKTFERAARDPVVGDRDYTSVYRLINPLGFRDSKL